MEKLEELQQAYFDLGFVPKKAIKKIKNRFSTAVENYIEKVKGLSDEEREDFAVKSEIERIKDDPNSGNKLYRKEQQLRKQIQQLENDISLWKNNLEFFASSKTADKLKNEFNEKIAAGEDEVIQLKHQLRMIRNA